MRAESELEEAEGDEGGETEESLRSEIRRYGSTTS